LSRLDFVGRSRASILAIVLGALLALGLVACGSGDNADLLPGSTASEITSNLDQVKELATEGDCVGAESAALAVSTQIEALGGVDKKLKQALREGATRLNEVVADCEEAPEEVEEETAPAVEEAEEPEAEEKKPKPEKADKPDKAEQPQKDQEAEEEGEDATEPTLPPQAEGKAKGHEKPEEEAPPAETGGGTSAGGVGPATPAEGK
jgi:outer membrane biosynthesis protein TonB